MKGCTRTTARIRVMRRCSPIPADRTRTRSPMPRSNQRMFWPRSRIEVQRTWPVVVHRRHDSTFRARYAWHHRLSHIVRVERCKHVDGTMSKSGARQIRHRLDCCAARSSLNTAHRRSQGSGKIRTRFGTLSQLRAHGTMRVDWRRNQAGLAGCPRLCRPASDGRR